MSIITMMFVIFLWAYTSDDIGTDHSYSYETNHRSYGGSENSQQHWSGVAERGVKVWYQQIPIAKPKGMSVEEGVAALNGYNYDFLDQAEAEVRRFIKNSRKRDVTAIVTGGQVYQGFPDYSGGYLSHFKVMMKHKGDGLPVYADEELDSWLTEHIMDIA